MEPRFLDTNILLRYLTRDDEEKAERTYELLKRVERGEESVEASPLVAFEFVFMRHRRYRMPRHPVRDLLRPILVLAHLRLDGKPVFLRALDLFVQYNVDFTNAFNVAAMEARGVSGIHGWDEDFDRFPGVRRLEPPEDGRPS